MGGFRTPGFTALAEVETGLDVHEQLRLLYVAATRARDHLVVSLHRKEGTPCHAASLAGVIESIPELWRGLDGEWLRLRPSPAGTAVRVPPRDFLTDRREWDAARAARIEATRAVPVRAATAIAAQGHDAKDEPDVTAPSWRRGRAGTAFGRAVHAVLQSVDLATGDGVGAIARAQAAAEGVDDLAKDVAGTARAAIASDAVRAAVASGRSWRELYVAAPVGPTLVEGFVDLAYDPGDGRGLVIVDYKTDALPTDAVDAAVHRYRLQLAAYALVLGELGQPVDRAVLLFVGAGHASARDVPDLAAAVSEVRQLVGG
jgi:ATP-dependent exoDNAse (exonuclease V) beta subunit